MATIQVIQGFQKIKDSYQIINTNDQAINNQLGFHISGVADRHSANAVVFTPITNISATDVQGAITQVNERVSNIIASSGTSSTEVVDARLSATYGSFVTLKSRLDNADTRIENTEKPDQQTLNLTELSQIQSVTDSYNGIAETEVGGATLNQVVVNGDFSNGTTGWGKLTTTLSTPTDATIDTTIKYFGTQSAKIKAENNSKSIAKEFDFPTGTKVFVFGFVYKISGTNPLFYVLPKGAISGSILTMMNDTVYNNAPLNTWIRYSGIVTVTNGGIRVVAGREAPSTYEMNIDGITAYPITGTPYENYTTDQMNALVNTYWEGLRSTQSVELGSRGRNVIQVISPSTMTATFPSSSVINLGFATFDLNGGASAGLTTLKYKVKPNTNYRLSTKMKCTVSGGQVSDIIVDKNGLTIINIAKTLTTSDAIYTTAFSSGANDIIEIRYRRVTTSGIVTISEIMLNEGSTALPYEPFTGSTAKITYTDPTKFDGALLPNLVKNSTAYKDGKWASVKRVGRHILTSGDIGSLVTTSANLDRVRIIRANLTGVFTQLGGVTPNRWIVPNFSRYLLTSIVDDAQYANQFIDTFSIDNAHLILSVPKGTYATLAAAQTALAGTVIYYELATPLTLTESQFAENGIVVDGVLTSNNDFTEFVVQDYDLFAPTSVTYATNLAKSVENLKESVQGLRAVVNNQNLINLEFDARITLLE